MLTNFYWFQHRDFEEIQRRLQGREPLILESLSVQKFTRRLPTEIVSDPINDVDSDPYEEGNEMHRQLRGHQVICFLVEHILWLGW